MASASPKQPLFAEYPPADVLISLGSASLFLLICAIALKASAGTAELRPSMNEKFIESPAKPVKIIPVIDLDAPLLKLGGKPDPRKLPDRWIKKGAQPRVEKKAHVSSAAEKDIENIPPPDLPVAQKADPPPPKDAEETKQVDVPAPAVKEPIAPSNVPIVGHQDGVQGGTETDPLKARAVDLYRARVIGWFSSRFRVKGSGLPMAELLKFRAAASVIIGADRTVQSYSITPSGNTVFDAAARAALESAKGQALPPPPDNYPDIAQSQIQLTFICKEQRCD